MMSKYSILKVFENYYQEVLGVVDVEQTIADAVEEGTTVEAMNATAQTAAWTAEAAVAANPTPYTVAAAIVALESAIAMDAVMLAKHKKDGADDAQIWADATGLLANISALVTVTAALAPPTWPAVPYTAGFAVAMTAVSLGLDNASEIESFFTGLNGYIFDGISYLSADTNGAGGVATGAGAAGGESASIVPLQLSPIALDLNGGGLNVVGGSSSGTSVLFDLNGDGVKTSNAWLSSYDAWLALDRNANGTIDSGLELFGDSTPLQAGGTGAHGYVALGEYDQNNDGVINSSDAIYSDLKLWRDYNQDGISQSNELAGLAASGVQSIGVDVETGNWPIGNDNTIIAKGTYTKIDGSTGTTGETTVEAMNATAQSAAWAAELAVAASPNPYTVTFTQTQT